MIGHCPWRSSLSIGLAVWCAVAAGCGGTGGAPLAEEEHRIRALATLYVRYGANPTHRGKAPPDEQSFKEFILQLPPQELKALRISNVDELFTSPRDHQPYVVRYGMKAPGVGAVGGGVVGPGQKNVAPKKPDAPPGDERAGPVIVHEKVGVGGKRYVAYATGQVELVNAERARALNVQ